MTTLFSPPGCGWAIDNSYDENDIHGDDRDNTNSLIMDPTKNDDLGLADPYQAQQRTRTLTPRKVCSLWKKKRKAEKKRLEAAMREEAQFVDDLEIHSELKLNALKIQRSFERRLTTGDDSDEELQRASYEKYGSRAEFMRGLRL